MAAAIAVVGAASRKAAGADDRRDLAIDADLANAVVTRIGEINIAGRIDDGRAWSVKQCHGCQSAIEATPAGAGTG